MSLLLKLLLSQLFSSFPFFDSLLWCYEIISCLHPLARFTLATSGELVLDVDVALDAQRVYAATVSPPWLAVLSVLLPSFPFPHNDLTFSVLSASILAIFTTAHSCLFNNAVTNELYLSSYIS